MPLALLRAAARQRVLVPPGGFAGFAQQTPAVQNQFQRAGRIGGKTTQRRRKSKRSSIRRKKGGGFSGVRTLGKGKLRRRKSRKNGSRLTKGSPAAKRHMAKLRRMRKR